MVGQHGAKAATAGPHHQVVFFVVALAVHLIEAAELRQHAPRDQHAEAHRRRHVAHLGQHCRQGTKGRARAAPVSRYVA